MLLFELATRRARFGRDCWMSRWVARYISVQVDGAVMFVQTLISHGGQTRPLLFGRMWLRWVTDEVSRGAWSKRCIDQAISHSTTNHEHS